MTLSFKNDPAFWQSDAFYRYVAEFSSQGIVAIDASYRYVFVNDSAARIFGRKRNEMLGASALTQGVEGSEEETRAIVARRRAGVAEQFEYRIRRPDGEVRWVLFDSQPIIDDKGEFRGALASATDITERREMEDELRQREKQLSAAEQIARFGSWSWDVTSGDVLWSDELYRIFGMRPQSERPSLERFLARVHPDDRDRARRHLEGSIVSRAPFQYAARVMHTDGTPRHIVTRGRVITDARGEPRRAVGIAMDITERIEGEARLHQLMYHDHVTQLPNRLLLHQRLDECFARAIRYRRNCALLFIDLDRFKAVNDSLGPSAGDQLLASTAQRLAGSVNRTDFVAHLGGDKFAVLLEETHGPSSIAVTAAHLLAEIAKPLTVEGEEIQLTASIGIACFPNDGDSADALLKHASNAMHASKKAGRECYRFYAREMSDEANQRLRLTHGLERALENDEFFLVYEPRRCIDTSRIVATQASLRWQAPGEKVRRGEDFLDAAEETGRAGEIERWMMSRACADLARWRRKGHDPGKLSIVLASEQVLLDDFVQFARDTLGQNGLTAADMELEIAERICAQNFEAIRDVVTRLAADGVSIVVGDIGVSETRCPELLDLPLDAFKINTRFVQALDSNFKGAIAAEAVALVARRMNVPLCAEGVESERQVELLRNYGCRAIQGPLVSLPLPAFALEEFLQEALQASA